MYSDDNYFLSIPGIDIYNDRKQKDIAIVTDDLFSGAQSDNGYPEVYSAELPFDHLYCKKGDKYQDFFIAGG